MLQDEENERGTSDLWLLRVIFHAVNELMAVKANLGYLPLKHLIV